MLQKYYNFHIFENGTIKALDFKIGKELWTNNGYENCGTRYTIDKEGNLYLYSKPGYRFYVINKDGKTLNNIQLDWREWDYKQPNDNSIIDRVYVEYENEKPSKYIMYYVQEEGDGDSMCLTINLKNNKVEIKNTDPTLDTFD